MTAMTAMTAVPGRGGWAVTPAAGGGGVPLVLVVTGDRDDGRLLTGLLRRQGYEVLWAVSPAEAVELAAWEPVSLVLVHGATCAGVDPGRVRELRVVAPSAALVLVGEEPGEGRLIDLLDAGADDYLSGRLRGRVLTARLRARLRRAAPVPASGLPSRPDVGPIRVGPLTVDPDRRRVLVGTEVLPLRPKEFDVLAYLVSRSGAVVRRGDLLRDLWDRPDRVSAKALNTQVFALRRKLREQPRDVGGIVTLRGLGYRYDAASEPRPPAAPGHPLPGPSVREVSGVPVREVSGVPVDERAVRERAVPGRGCVPVREVVAPRSARTGAPGNELVGVFGAG